MKRTAKQPGKVAQPAQVAPRNQKRPGSRAARAQQQLTDIAKLRARGEKALRRAERLQAAVKAFREQLGPDVTAAREPDFGTRRTIGSRRG